MMTLPNKNPCPLCHGVDTVPYHSDRARDYLNCLVCALVFVPAVQHLSQAEEKAEYDRHDNQPEDPGYRRFLNRLYEPLNQCLAPGSRGLDVGCGPGPTLSVMFAEAGHSVALYDPYYAPDRSVLDHPYDFISLSEVVEHMAAPGRDLDCLWDSLVPGGYLGIMTKRVRDRQAFATWHYITDQTHISFFSEKTFQWLVGRWSVAKEATSLMIVGDDVVIICKGAAPI